MAAAAAPQPAPRHRPPRPRAVRGVARIVAAATLLSLCWAAAPRGAVGGPGLTEGVKRFPGGAFPALGRFPSVCSLQCRTGALENGDRGLTVGGTLYPWGDRTCGAMLDLSRASRVSPSDPDGLVVMGIEERGLAARVARLARSRGTARGRAMATDEVYAPRPILNPGLCPVAQQALVHEEDTLNILGLQRNTMQGAVSRHIGNYDIIGYSRSTLGVCGTAQCADVTAVDTTGDQACGIVCMNANSSRCSCQGTTVLTAAGADGVERSVSLADRRRLSLGRALLAQTDWLGAAGGPAGLWNLTAALVFASVWPDRAGPHPHVPAMTRMAASLRGVPGGQDPFLADAAGTNLLLLDNTSTVWPQQLASVLCMPPATSFLRRPDLVCGGLGPSVYDRPDGERPRTLAGQPLPNSKFHQTRAHMSWGVVRNNQGGVAEGDVPIVFNGTAATFTASPFPPVSSGPPEEALALYGTREINSASAVERRVAASLRRRLLYLPTRAGDVRTSAELTNRLMTYHLDATAEKALGRMAVTHDGSAFGVDPPPPPAVWQDIGLAILVVLPEAVAIVATTVGTRSWRRREAAALGFLIVAGLVSLAAIVALAVQERVGANWRAATTRTAVGSRFPIGIDNRRVADASTDLTGTEVLLLETFIVAARLGYRPRRLIAIAAAVSAAYAVCSVVAVAVALCSMRAARVAAAAAAAAAAEAEGGEAAGLVRRSDSVDGPDGGGVNPSAAAARRWWQALRDALHVAVARGRREAK